MDDTKQQSNPTTASSEKEFVTLRASFPKVIADDFNAQYLAAKEVNLKQNGDKKLSKTQFLGQLFTVGMNSLYVQSQTPTLPTPEPEKIIEEKIVYQKEDASLWKMIAAVLGVLLALVLYARFSD